MVIVYHIQVKSSSSTQVQVELDTLLITYTNAMIEDAAWNLT